MRKISFLRVLALLEGKNVDEVILVGGQALNAWAEHFQLASPEREGLYGFALSRDIDFLAGRIAAVRLGTALGANVQVAGMDAHTPNTALATTVIDGEEITIDFLRHLQGFSERDLADARKMAAQVPNTSVRIGVLHPVHCLQSQLANVYGRELNRRASSPEPDREIRRVRLAIAICRRAISEYLAAGDAGSARAVIERMMALAQEDPYQRAVFEDRMDPMLEGPVDPALGDDFVVKRLPQLQDAVARATERYGRKMRRSGKKMLVSGGNGPGE